MNVGQEQQQRCQGLAGLGQAEFTGGGDGIGGVCTGVCQGHHVSA